MKLRNILMALVLAVASLLSLRPTAFAQSREEGQSAFSAAGKQKTPPRKARPKPKAPRKTPSPTQKKPGKKPAPQPSVAPPAQGQQPSAPVPAPVVPSVDAAPSHGAQPQRDSDGTGSAPHDPRERPEQSRGEAPPDNGAAPQPEEPVQVPGAPNSDLPGVNPEERHQAPGAPQAAPELSRGEAPRDSEQAPQPQAPMASPVASYQAPAMASPVDDAEGRREEALRRLQETTEDDAPELGDAMSEAVVDTWVANTGECPPPELVSQLAQMMDDAEGGMTDEDVENCLAGAALPPESLTEDPLPNFDKVPEYCLTQPYDEQSLQDMTEQVNVLGALMEETEEEEQSAEPEEGAQEALSPEEKKAAEMRERQERLDQVTCVTKQQAAQERRKQQETRIAGTEKNLRGLEADISSLSGWGLVGTWAWIDGTLSAARGKRDSTAAMLAEQKAQLEVLTREAEELAKVDCFSPQSRAGGPEGEGSKVLLQTADDRESDRKFKESLGSSMKFSGQWYDGLKLAQKGIVVAAAAGTMFTTGGAVGPVWIWAFPSGMAIALVSSSAENAAQLPEKGLAKAVSDATLQTVSYAPAALAGSVGGAGGNLVTVRLTKAFPAYFAEETTFRWVLLKMAGAAPVGTAATAEEIAPDVVSQKMSADEVALQLAQGTGRAGLAGTLPPGISKQILGSLALSASFLALQGKLNSEGLQESGPSTLIQVATGLIPSICARGAKVRAANSAVPGSSGPNLVKKFPGGPMTPGERRARVVAGKTELAELKKPILEEIAETRPGAVDGAKRFFDKISRKTDYDQPYGRDLPWLQVDGPRRPPSVHKWQGTDGKMYSISYTQDPASGRLTWAGPVMESTPFGDMLPGSLVHAVRIREKQFDAMAQRGVASTPADFRRAASDWLVETKERVNWGKEPWSTTWKESVVLKNANGEQARFTYELKSNGEVADFQYLKRELPDEILKIR